MSFEGIPQKPNRKEQIDQSNMLIDGVLDDAFTVEDVVAAVANQEDPILKEELENKITREIEKTLHYVVDEGKAPKSGRSERVIPKKEEEDINHLREHVINTLGELKDRLRKIII